MPGLNPELSKLTGEHSNLCAGLSESIYSGSMSIKIKADKPVSATVFRLVPHHDGRLYRNENNTMSCIQPGSSARTYQSLVDDGMEFEQAGHSPFTMNIEPHDGQLYFTVKVRASYDAFDDNSPCDAPFAGDATCSIGPFAAMAIRTSSIFMQRPTPEANGCIWVLKLS
ncbi:hypothetical protein [Salinisphaera sp. G21_0]|uniref:hypothetical protein n=1 Tax=Salinisphaera sp. G21_0 TaxID=2821094 RepID=UPI001ADC31A8|nr:hypothetical protein [Salinisphaera sp. G21_0]MBO9480735.1 hypothetical protein [Salinisphaera sp. G21_0]